MHSTIYEFSIPLSLLHSPYEIKDTRLTHAANELRVRWAEPEGDEGKADIDGVKGVNLEF